MSGKHRDVKRINLPAVGIPTGGQAPLGEPTAAQRLPQQVFPPTAVTVVATTTIAPDGREVPALLITWQAPALAPSTYDVQLTLPDGSVITDRTGHNNQAQLDSDPQSLLWTQVLSPGTSYRVAVRSIGLAGSVPSDYVAATPDPVTTPRDTIAPTWPGGAALVADFTTADLVLTLASGSVPTDADLAHIQVNIWTDSGKTVPLLSTLIPAAPGQAWRYLWSNNDNRLAAGNLGAPSVFCEVRPRDGAGNLGTARSVTATNAHPSDLTELTTSWADDTGTAGTSCSIACTAVSDTDLAGYQFTIDGVVQPLQAAPQLEYTLAKNSLDHAGTPNPNLTISAVAVDVFGQVSTTPATALATNAAPQAVTALTTNWESDAGLADEDFVATWSHNTPADHQLYRCTFGGLTFDVIDREFRMPFSRNLALAGGPFYLSQTFSVVARDLFNQASTAATKTIANAAPPQPSVVITPFYNAIAVLAPIAAGVPADLLRYDYVLYQSATSGGAYTNVKAFSDISPAPIIDNVPGTGYYKVGARVYDMFGQARAEVLSSASYMDPLSLEELRKFATYRDSIGTSSSALDALKDDTVASGGILYASGATWKWTEVARPATFRQRNISIAATAGVGYVGTTNDNGVTWSWYSGPLLADGRTLTAVASEAAAQSAALSLPSDGTWQLPGYVEATTVRLGHRNTGASYTLREFFARSYLQIDDLDAQIIRGMSVSGNQFVARYLSALTATLGQVDILAYVPDSGGSAVGGYLRSGQTDYDTGTGFWLGWDTAAGLPKFSLGNASGNKLTWNGTTLNIVGAITVTGGNALTTSTNYAGSTSPGGAALDTSAVNGVAAATVQGGAARANAGLNGAGYVALPVRGSSISGTPATGLNMTATELGYYNGAAWTTYLNNAGQFYFRGGSGANLIWDGTYLSGRNASDQWQWYTDATSGGLVAGAGAVSIDRNGVAITGRDLTADPAGTSSIPQNVSWIVGGTVMAAIEGYRRSGSGYLHMRAAGRINVVSNSIRMSSASASPLIVDVYGTVAADYISSLGAITAYGDLVTEQSVNVKSGYVWRANSEGQLGWRIRSAAEGGWRWQCVDGASNEYFGVEFSSGNVTVRGSLAVQGNVATFGSAIANLDVALALQGTSSAGNNRYIDIGNGFGTHDALRIIRWANHSSQIYHRGSNIFWIGTLDTAELRLGTAGTERLIIGGGGNIGIGRSVDSNIRLLVRGSSTANNQYAAWIENSAGTCVFALRNDAADNYSIIAWRIGSDARLKCNIRAIEPDTVSRLDLVRPVGYDRIVGDQHQPEYGVIAQELIAVYPDLVSQGPDGYYAVRYNDLIALLIAGYQRQQQRIAQLEQAQIGKRLRTFLRRLLRSAA